MMVISRKCSRSCINFLKRNFESISTAKTKLTEDDVEEIRIPVPWGHIAAKWWGDKNNKTVLCCHGWQDNANSFDTLIPLLPPRYSYLAIDLPGHGLSSHLPKGFFYNTFDVITMYRRLQSYFNWEKIPYMGHSYGAVAGFMFGTCFPESLDFFIAIDAIKPLSRYPEKLFKEGSKVYDKMLFYDSFTKESRPLYSKEELIQRWIKGSNDSVTEKSCEILMKRGGEEVNGLFALTRDIRVKTGFNSTYTTKEILKLSESFKCKVLLIKAKNKLNFNDKDGEEAVIESVKKHAKYFEEHELPGTHHLHLNNPEVVAPVINSFLETVEKNF